MSKRNRDNNKYQIEYERQLKSSLQKRPSNVISTDKEELLLGMVLNHPDLIFQVDDRFFGTEECYTLFQEIKGLDKTTKAELLLAIRNTMYFDYAITLQSNYDTEHRSTFDKTVLYLEDLRLKRLEVLCSTMKVEHIDSNDYVFEVNRFYEKESIPAIDVDYETIKQIADFTESGIADGSIGRGYLTGMTPIDDIIESITTDDVIVIAARPAIGKTTFVVDMCKNMAKKNGQPILFNSLEVPKWRLITKFISCISGIPEWEIKKNHNNCILSDNFQKAKSELSKMPIEIVEGAYNPKQLESQVKIINSRRKNRGEEPIRFVVQDYVQIKESGKDFNTQKQEMDYVLKEELKMAKKYGFIPIYLSQINRGVEVRGGTKKPSMADLKDTGNLEQAGRKILLLHRSEYYGILEDENGNSLVNTMEVIVAKNSNGKTGQTIFKDIRMDCNRIHTFDTDFDLNNIGSSKNSDFPKINPDDFLPF